MLSWFTTFDSMPRKSCNAIDSNKSEAGFAATRTRFFVPAARARQELRQEFKTSEALLRGTCPHLNVCRIFSLEACCESSVGAYSQRLSGSVRAAILARTGKTDSIATLYSIFAAELHDFAAGFP